MNLRDLARLAPHKLADLAVDLEFGIARRRALASGALEADLAGLFRDAGRAASVRMDSIVNTITGQGGQFDAGATSAARVQARRYLGWDDLTTLYEQGGYPSRIVDLVADDTTRKGWKFVEGDANNNADHDGDAVDTVDLLVADEERLGIRATYRDAMVAARQYGGALIWKVVDEDVRPSDRKSIGGALAEPLDLSRLRSVTALHVLDPTEATVVAWEEDPTSPNWRKPRLYQLHPTGAGYGVGAVVHASRFVYVPGFRLSAARRYRSGGWDLSWIDVAYQAISNKIQIDTGGATLARRFVWNVVRMNDLAQIEATKKAETLDKRIRSYIQSVNMLGAVVLGANEDFTSQATSVAGWRDLDEAASRNLVAVTRIPPGLLFGDQPSGLNATDASGQSNWRDVVSSEQSTLLRPGLRDLGRALLRSRQGPTRGEEPPGWTVTFNPLDELTEGQRAELAYKRAQTRQIQIAIGDALPELDVATGYPYDAAGDDERKLADDDGADKGGTSGDPMDPTAPPAGATPVPGAPAPTPDPKPAATPATPAGGQAAPAPAVPGAGPTATDVASVDVALNGAQVTSALEVLDRVRLGTLSPAAAEAVFVRLFALSTEGARDLVANIEIKPAPEPAPAPVPPATPPPVPPKGPPATTDPKAPPAAP